MKVNGVEFLPGDIVGCLGNSFTSHIINIGTYGIPFYGLSHVGIIAESMDNRVLLYESTTLNKYPCAVKGVLFNGTQAQEIDRKIDSYEGKIWHYPLKKPLRVWERRNLSKFLNRKLGIPYDSIGAFRSGGKGFSWLESRMHKENLSSIFCSEWCASAHNYIERFDTDNLSKWNPNAFAREERRRDILLKPIRIK